MNLVNPFRFAGVETLVQRGFDQLADTESSTTITLDTPVSTENTFATVGVRGVTGGSYYMGRNMVIATLGGISGGKYTEVVISRNNTSGAVDVEWQVVTSPDFTVEMVEFSITSTNTTNTATINSVTLSESFIIGSYSPTDRDWGEGACQLEFDNSTTIRATRNTGSQTTDITCYVVSIAGASVQTIDYSLTSDISNETITSVTTADTFLIDHRRSSPGSRSRGNGGDIAVRTRLTSSTNVEIEREETDNTITGTIFVVEWSGFSVQTEDLSDQGTSANGTISSVDTAKTFLMSHMAGNAKLFNGDTNIDYEDQPCHAQRLTSSTTVRFERHANDSSLARGADVHFQAISIN